MMIELFLLECEKYLLSSFSELSSITGTYCIFVFSIKNVEIINTKKAISKMVPPTIKYTITRVSFKLNGFKLYIHMPEVNPTAQTMPRML